MTLGGSLTYNGANTAAAGNLTISNLVAGDNLTLSGSATLAGKNVGSQSITSFSGLTLSGASAANYTIVGAAARSRSPSAITLSGSRTYDGTSTAAASVLTISNEISWRQPDALG